MNHRLYNIAVPPVDEWRFPEPDEKGEPVSTQWRSCHYKVNQMDSVTKLHFNATHTPDLSAWVKWAVTACDSKVVWLLLVAHTPSARIQLMSPETKNVMNKKK